MPLDKTKIKTNRVSNLPPVKPGTYFGRIVQVVGLGVQPQSDWKTGEVKPPKEDLLVTVEFPKLRMEVDGENRPRWFSRRFTVSNAEMSNMVKVLDPLLPEGSTNYRDLVNIPVVVTLGVTANGNPRIDTMSMAPEEVAVAELENEPSSFDFYEPTLDDWNSLREWQKKVVMGAKDFEGSVLETLLLSEGVLDE